MDKQELWTKEEIAEHLKTNLTDKAGSYSAAVVVAALYKKLYGEFPKIGLSGAQAECADSVIPRLPDSFKEKEFDHTSMDARVWAKEFIRIYNDKTKGIVTPTYLDEGLMIAWFANAIMAGYDEANRRKPEHKEPLQMNGSNICHMKEESSMTYYPDIEKQLFPECSKTCKLVNVFGVGECESICPEKFKKKHNKIEKLKTTKPIDEIVYELFKKVTEIINRLNEEDK